MSWLPSASLEALKARADFNRYIREFFIQRNVMEVETPLLSKAAVSDVHLSPIKAHCLNRPYYLQTSPEYAMKRLLAAGSGDIFQICKVFRDEELGARHNPEFSMLEYYRLNFDLISLKDEVAQLVGDYLQLQKRIDLTYRQAFELYAQFDPFTISDHDLLVMAQKYVGDLVLNRDGCLDLLMTHAVEPNLPNNALIFISHYPASQAALAKTYENENGQWLAQRFELYVNGLELANGYQELTDVNEQKKRFQQDSESRDDIRLEDQNFLAALEQGLPECAGVALGLDRILMLKMQATDIRTVLSFNIENA